MKFVIDPKLPKNAGTIIIGEKYAELLKYSLENLGIKTIFVPDNPNVDKRISGHADMSAVHLGGNKLALAPYLKGSAFSESMQQMGIELYYPEMEQSENYPFDAGLNFSVFGNKIIYSPKSAQKELVSYLTNDRGYRAIEVKQGYTSCSVCVLGKNLIITSDPGIHKRAVQEGIEALKISFGHIKLPGFEYGFIGGASFKICEDTVAFTGVLDEHPDKEIIFDFLSLHNIKHVYITKKPAFDIGGAIQIVEK